ncbi:MAG: hypothetical protein COW24_02585 [Candidatus Kerfeldbacteria bacterium CG15_BIG_FIL_POST_REV_8_21_14_020_45_12]|uniref:tRNA/rRNA methyltransferase SpoU type domain-containing protein n=1 Tax=Candidatus Kerfeldbacteria bacterium CG15_BIG_FIL_POST_REV_8_21_14_020_45_12 TaxID=2014247 RepID=A0A2M7H417_9BACT|nr:MAG: hypothetical protein COW24_02585 [Candidatus Kerfeldbacteria bacterium CG15_BIG_FIL_POST_REV_8_21_14_020_45_12]PJA93885.1 MAG: hypothetical protein CO132_00850 [Candidatus Kerfeldbacteria bacterium CG_4_9_14_3_um_filter_45_8]
MLTRSQEKMIRALHRKKDRLETGLCLVEGKKVIEAAGMAVEFTFTPTDTELFSELVTTDSPQQLAAVARVPRWSDEALLERPVLVVLDGVQDPGNVGTILRLCLGFDAGLILVESADPTSPKVVRASVGAIFQVPWRAISRAEAPDWIHSLNRTIYRLEARPEASVLLYETNQDPIVLIAGSEGNGIQLDIPGQSIVINHNEALESLNVATALAIALHSKYRN